MVGVSTNHVLSTTCSRRCVLIDVATGEMELQPMVAIEMPGGPIAGLCLRSPSVAHVDPPLVAVATRASWAGIWTIGDTIARRLTPQHSGPVNAVVLSPDGQFMALGTGYYPLKEEYRKASVELWTTSSEPELLASTLLPDVVVDQLVWDRGSSRLLALTGIMSQGGGHWWVFDADRFALLDAGSTDSCMFIAAGFARGGEAIVAVSRDRAEVHRLGESHEIVRWWTFSEEIVSAAVSAETGEAILSTGDVIDLDGHRVTHLQAFPDCAGVAICPGGGYVALSSSGRLRVWNGIG